MKKNRLLSFILYSICCLFVGFTFSLFAQSTNAAPGTGSPPTSAGIGLLITIIPLAVPLLIAVFKYFLPEVPTVLLPILAPLIGALIDFVTAKSTGASANPLLAAALGSAGVGLREIYDQIRATMPGSAQAAAKTVLLIAFIGLSLSFVGCQSGNKLQPGGAYAPVTTNVSIDASGATVTNVVATQAPDYAFFAVDSAFDLAYSSLDAVFTFEQQNRAMLWQVSPSIKHSLDQLRPTAVTIVRAYTAARQSYKANPTPAGLSALQTSLSQIQAAASAASAAIASVTNAPALKPSTTSTNKTSWLQYEPSAIPIPSKFEPARLIDIPTQFEPARAESI